MKLGWFFLQLFALGAYAQTEPGSFPAIDTTNRLITLETTPCRGTCPVHQLTVYATGKAHYVGQQYTDREGTYELKLTKQEVSRLKSKFEKADFFKFKTSYQAKVTDLPSTYLTYSNGKRTQTILDYYGAPQAVKQLESEVLALLKKKGWKKVKDKA